MKFGKAYNGIPAQYRDSVARTLKEMKKDGGEVPTPAKAWEMFKQVEANNKRNRDRAATERRRVLKHSHEAIGKALGDLATVRDLIGDIEEGNQNRFPTEAVAMWARAAMEESCRNLEQALCNLGVIKAPEDDPDGFGWFSHDGKLKSEMPSRK